MIRTYLINRKENPTKYRPEDIRTYRINQSHKLEEKEMKQTYLINTDWFVAPDGKQYKAAWGEVEILQDDFLGIKTNRASTNWYAKVGDKDRHVIIAGCQILYAVRADHPPNMGDSAEWQADATNGIKRFDAPSRIYIAQQITIDKQTQSKINQLVRESSSIQSLEKQIDIYQKDLDILERRSSYKGDLGRVTASYPSPKQQQDLVLTLKSCQKAIDHEKEQITRKALNQHSTPLYKEFESS